MEKYFTWSSQAPALWVADMNADPARCPHSSASWQALDIFVFANGQQYSPPRKYHLQAEELEWWEHTLCYIARSHYGPRYTMIELYSTDGRLINGPMELSNGGTYVAVIPPDSFIDTGYEKYLLKASRSWERRKSLLSGTMKVTNPDAVIVTGTIPEDEQKHVEEVRKGAKINTKPKSAKAHVVRPIKLNSVKASEAKGRSNPNMKSNIPKRIGATSTHKRSSIRTNTSVTKIMPKSGAVKIKTSEMEADKDFSKHIVTVTNEIIPTKDAEEEYELVNKYSHKTIILDKPSVALYTPLKVHSTANLSNLYINSEKDSLSVVRVPLSSNEPVIVQKEDDDSDADEIRSIIKQVIDSVFLLKSYEIGDIMPPRETLSEKCIYKYVTLINKGDTVTMNLHIEVKNAQGVSVSHEKKAKVINIPFEKKHNSSSQTNLHVKISLISLKEQQMETQKSSLEKIISDIYFHNQYDRPKVVVVKCPCCSHQYAFYETHAEQTKTKHFGKRIVVVMPVDTSDGTGVNNNSGKRKKSLNADAEEKDYKQSIASSVSSMAHPEEPHTENLKNLGYDKYESQLASESSPLSRSVQFEDTENDIIIKPTPDLVDKSTADASVLTDWCNIVLEAKIDDDGRYSFYLPSLEVLRDYNF